MPRSKGRCRGSASSGSTSSGPGSAAEDFSSDPDSQVGQAERRRAIKQLKIKGTKKSSAAAGRHIKRGSVSDSETFVSRMAANKGGSRKPRTLSESSKAPAKGGSSSAAKKKQSKMAKSPRKAPSTSKKDHVREEAKDDDSSSASDDDDHQQQARRPNRPPPAYDESDDSDHARRRASKLKTTRTKKKQYRASISSSGRSSSSSSASTSDSTSTSSLSSSEDRSSCESDSKSNRHRQHRGRHPCESSSDSDSVDGAKNVDSARSQELNHLLARDRANSKIASAVARLHRRKASLMMCSAAEETDGFTDPQVVRPPIGGGRRFSNSSVSSGSAPASRNSSRAASFCLKASTSGDKQKQRQKQQQQTSTKAKTSSKPGMPKRYDTAGQLSAQLASVIQTAIPEETGEDNETGSSDDHSDHSSGSSGDESEVDVSKKCSKMLRQKLRNLHKVSEEANAKKPLPAIPGPPELPLKNRRSVLLTGGETPSSRSRSGSAAVGASFAAGNRGRASSFQQQQQPRFGSGLKSSQSVPEGLLVPGRSAYLRAGGGVPRSRSNSKVAKASLDSITGASTLTMTGRRDRGNSFGSLAGSSSCSSSAGSAASSRRNSEVGQRPRMRSISSRSYSRSSRDSEGLFEAVMQSAARRLSQRCFIKGSIPERCLIDEPLEFSPEMLDAPLAPGWEEGYDRNSRAAAFRHKKTGFVTFEPPTELPRGWAEHFTSDGQLFYVNQSTGRSFWDRPPPDTDLNRHLNEAIEMLQTGGKFSKTKRGRNRTTRLIRCSDDLQFLMWLDPETETIKGFLPTADLVEALFCPNGDLNAIIVATADRTLELYRPDGHDIRTWLDAFKLLIRFEKHFLAKRRELLAAPAFRSSFAEVSRFQLSLLETGFLVRKWPAHKRIFKAALGRSGGLERGRAESLVEGSGEGGGSGPASWARKLMLSRKPMLRLLRLDSKARQLQWIDQLSGRPKGNLDLMEIVEIRHDPDDGMRFSICSKRRTLELEYMEHGGPGIGMASPTLEDALSALMFMVHFRDQLGIR